MVRIIYGGRPKGLPYPNLESVLKTRRGGARPSRRSRIRRAGLGPAPTKSGFAVGAAISRPPRRFPPPQGRPLRTPVTDMESGLGPCCRGGTPGRPLPIEVGDFLHKKNAPSKRTARSHLLFEREITPRPRRAPRQRGPPPARPPCRPRPARRRASRCGGRRSGRCGSGRPHRAQPRQRRRRASA